MISLIDKVNDMLIDTCYYSMGNLKAVIVTLLVNLVVIVLKGFEEMHAMLRHMEPWR